MERARGLKRGDSRLGVEGFGRSGWLTASTCGGRDRALAVAAGIRPRAARSRTGLVAGRTGMGQDVPRRSSPGLERGRRHCHAEELAAMAGAGVLGRVRGYAGRAWPCWSSDWSGLPLGKGGGEALTSRDYRERMGAGLTWASTSHELWMVLRCGASMADL
jgi:hypothetical protein